MAEPSDRRPLRTVGEPTDSPLTLIVMGFAVGAVLGGLLIVFGASSDLGVLLFLGWIVALAGAVLVLVGAVAAGVRLGMRWARYDEVH